MLVFRFNRARDRILLGLVLLTVIRASEAATEEQAIAVGAKPRPDFHQANPWAAEAMPLQPPPVIAVPDIFTPPAASMSRGFSATDFRPRKRTLLDRDPVVEAFGDAPMLRGTTVWQRLSDYRSRDRVRLLTLWESGGSTVSLQAGKRGDPSLQWTSTAMNRGGATRGLLDRLFSVSLAGAGATLRNATHAGGSAPAKQASIPVVAGNKP